MKNFTKCVIVVFCTSVGIGRLAWAELPDNCRDLFAKAGAVPGSSDCRQHAIMARGGMGSYTCTGNNGRKYAEAYCDTSANHDAVNDSSRVGSAALEELGQGSAAEIFARVASSIIYEPYHGHMRGPSIVAAAKLGNALDQATLLRSLLDQAGHTTRLVNGVLSPSAKQQLVSSSNLVNVSTTEQETTEQLQARLLALVDSEHHWVELLDNGRWLALDPTFPAAKWGSSYGKRHSVVESLPQDQLQHVRFAHSVLMSDGETRELGQYSFPVADLEHNPVSLVISASPLAQPPRKKASQPAAGLGGALAGLASPTGAKEDEADAQQVSGKRYNPRLVVAGKNYPLQAYETSTSTNAPTIVKEWLNIDLTLGEKTLRSTERVLFQSTTDREHPADQRHFVATILTSFIDEEFARRVKHTHSQALADIEAELTKDATAIEQREAKLAQILGHSLSLSFAAMADSFTQTLGTSNGVVFSHPLPRIYIVSTEGKWTREQSEGFGLQQLALDLRLDEVEAWPKDPGKIDATALTQLGRGLQQSILEGIVLEALPGAVPSTYTAAQVMEAASSTGVKLAALFSPDAPELQQIKNLPTPIKRQLMRTLAAGRHVVLPEAPVSLNQEPRWAWWDIDPQSGRLVGVIERGLHGAVVEYSILTQQTATDDQRAFVLGMLTGSVQTQMQLATAILAGESITNTVKARIEKTMKRLACSSCFHTKLEINIFAASGKVDCLELFKVSLKSVSRAVSMPFCEAYGKGFICATKAVLSGLQDLDVKWEKPVVLESPLTCGR